MLPSIEPGATVTLGPSIRTCRFGDVGAFVADNGSIIAHRYLFELGGSCWFIGDNNRHFDTRVSPDRVIGRVDEPRVLVAHSRNIGAALLRVMRRRIVAAIR